MLKNACFISSFVQKRLRGQLYFFIIWKSDGGKTVGTLSVLDNFLKLKMGRTSVSLLGMQNMSVEKPVFFPSDMIPFERSSLQISHGKALPPG